MRDKYWAMYTDIKHRESYYWHYQIRARRFNAIVNAICVFASASSIAGWSIWTQFPFLWGVILGTSQIVQILKPMFPFSKQILALHFFMPALSKLLIEIDYEWDKLNLFSKSDPEISRLIYSYNQQYNLLVSQFIGDTYFPVIKSCEKKAEIICKNYFSHKYNV